MTTERTKANEPKPAAPTPGDNRSAEDVDGNRAGAGAANKARGPNEPEVAPTDEGDVEKPSR